jgi:hypothetical protein
MPRFIPTLFRDPVLAGKLSENACFKEAEVLEFFFKVLIFLTIFFNQANCSKL